MDWLDKVHAEVMAEIDYETRHPQHLHGTDACPGCEEEQFCACGKELLSEQEHRNKVCGECL